jgi:hypothetical protein
MEDISTLQSAYENAKARGSELMVRHFATQKLFL